MPRLFIFLIILTHSITSLSQEEPVDISVNSQFWSDFNIKHEFDEKKAASGFLGYRTISPHVFDKLVAFGTYDILHTESPKFMNLKKPLINSFHLGGGLYYTNNVNEENNFEFRMTQGLKFFLPSIKQLPLKNYFRMEQRFQKTFDGSNWNASLRFRYKISTIIEWKKHLFEFNKGMYLPMSIEFFFSATGADRENDVIRISPGVGYKFSDEWRGEFYLSYHYTNNTTDDQASSNDFVFRLRIYKAHIKKKAPKIDTREEDIKELIE